MKQVKFSRSCAPYTTGELAVFPDDRADELVERGMASLVKKETTTTKKLNRRLKSRNRMVTTDD